MISTATEIFMRQAEAEKRIDPMRKILDQMAQEMFRKMLDTKVPCIKYGKRKRRYRRLFEADLAARRVKIDASGGVVVQPITKENFYR